MQRIKGQLSYNNMEERYGIMVIRLLCGSHVDVWNNRKWCPDIMEKNKDGEWYLIRTGFKGKELEGLMVRYKYSDEDVD